MTNPTSTPGLSLPEAITRMLKGEVMVDDDSASFRIRHVQSCDFIMIELFRPSLRVWDTFAVMSPDGWRVATPEELAEIER